MKPTELRTGNYFKASAYSPSTPMTYFFEAQFVRFYDFKPFSCYDKVHAYRYMAQAWTLGPADVSTTKSQPWSLKIVRFGCNLFSNSNFEARWLEKKPNQLNDWAF